MTQLAWWSPEIGLHLLRRAHIRKFPAQPTDGLYKMSIYLQAWRLVARRQDKEALELAIGRIRLLHSTLREPLGA